jgi:hemolysin III
MSQLSLPAGVSNGTASKPVFDQREAAINNTPPPLHNIDFTEEFVHSAIHAIGVLFGIAAIPLLAALAVKNAHGGVMMATCIYGFSFLMVFTSSTVYHGLQHTVHRKMLEVFDHISIYFFIAGTYTPLIFAYMNNATGILMLWLLWGLVLAGVLFKICFGCRYNIVSTIVYLLMGWMLVWTGGDFFKAMPVSVIGLIGAGAVLYSTGVIFYLRNKVRWNHAIWHALVLAAAVCHYLAVYKSVGGV